MKRCRLVLEVKPELAASLRAKCKRDAVPYAAVLRAFTQRFVGYEGFQYMLISPGTVRRWLALSGAGEGETSEKQGR